MKILVSAIACSPTGGSEGGVGWNAIRAIAATNEVWVITHGHCRAAIEEAQKAGLIPQEIRFRYLCAARPWNRNRLMARAQSWIRFMDFNRRVLEAALAWHAEESFDLVHQVTYATWRIPSPLWKMPIPFVWGPIGGSGVLPRHFRMRLGLKALLLELARDFQTRIALNSKTLHDCVRKSAVILVANKETLDFIRPLRGDRTLVQLPVAYLDPQKIKQFKRPESQVNDSGPLRVFAGGNIEARKGVDMALHALARARDEGLDFRYTVAGGGPDVPRLRQLSRYLGISDQVEFHPGYSGEEYVEALKNSDVYLLPSLRETLGMTLQEAVLAGCLPIVADASAQGEIVNMAGGDAVPATDMETLINGMAVALLKADRDRLNMRKRAGQSSQKVAEYFSEARYKSVLSNAYDIASD